jgi:hypothetical protein
MPMRLCTTPMPHYVAVEVMSGVSSFHLVHRRDIIRGYLWEFLEDVE